VASSRSKTIEIVSWRSFRRHLTVAFFTVCVCSFFVQSFVSLLLNQ
jgi:hypothetical protein